MELKGTVKMRSIEKEMECVLVMAFEESVTEVMGSDGDIKQIE